MRQGTQGDFAELHPSWTWSTRDFAASRDGSGYVIHGRGMRGAQFLRELPYVEGHPALQFMRHGKFYATDTVELDALLAYLQKKLESL